MESIQKNTCRTCLRQDSSIKYEIYFMISALKMCASVQIEPNDGLPCGMCNNCYHQFTNALQFRMLCEKSDRLLRSMSADLESFTVMATGKLNQSLEIDTKIELIEYKPAGEEDSHEERNDSGTDDDLSLNTRKLNLQAKHENTPNIGQTQRETSSNMPLLKCKYCHVKFHNIKVRQVHEAKHEEKHVCSECGKEYPTRRQLYSHRHNHKRRQGNHLCPTCGKCFSMPEYLVRHVRTHTGQHPYKCPHCPNRTFNQRNQLKSHLVTHTKEKSFLCNICGNAYARSRSLAVHMRRIHPQPNAKRDFACTICNKVFIDKRDLSSHSAIHRRAGQFICKVCGKAFNRSSNLRVHEQIHSEHRPHPCPHCPRSFIQKHVLNTHLKTHADKMTSTQW